jgi:Tripartite tricarboxylate transporter family receptor
VVNGALYSLSYDVLNDFEPIASLGSTPYVLFARKTMPANDLNELIAWLKANPDKASAGNVGSSVLKLIPVFFQKQTAPRRKFLHLAAATAALQGSHRCHKMLGDLELPSQLISIPKMFQTNIAAETLIASTRSACARERMSTPIASANFDARPIHRPLAGWS